jgi:hypothetical protein
MRIVPLLLVAVIAAVAIAIKYLPWWGLLLGALGLVVIGKFVLKRLFFRLLITPFKLKGAVLKGASVEVHSVTTAVAPPTTDAAPADATPRNYYSVEASIRPVQSDTPFGAWEPGELRLVRPESVIDASPDTPSDDDDTCEIKSIEVQLEGGFEPHNGIKLPGPQRLRLLIAVKPGSARLKFRYYFEEFGSVTLPASATAQAA